jgi:hypothetical protein
MTRLLLAASAGLLLLNACKTQELPLTPAQRTDKGYTFTSAITPEFIRPHIYTLADDSMQGRDTSSPEELIAARYLADFHKGLGLLPAGDDSTYFQTVPFVGSVTRGYTFTFTTTSGTNTLTANADHSDPILVISGARGPQEGAIVFGGLGIQDTTLGIRHLDGVDVRGNYVLIFNDIPSSATGWTPNRRYRDLVLNRGAKGIITISSDSAADFALDVDLMRGGFGEPSGLRLPAANAQPRLQLQYYTIQPDLASAILGGGLNEQGVRDLEASLAANPRNFTPRAVSASLSVNGVTGDESFPGRNVAALLPGSDPELTHEVIVLMAHYDHVGVGAADESGDRIYNGADDNGSGTVGLMAIANALTEAKKAGAGPRRSVLFLHVTGEEKGLLGSRYYSDNPTVPIANVAAALNIDMIGRIEAKRYESGDTNYVYLIGASLISSKVDSLVRAANAKTVNIFLDPGLNDLNDPQQIYRRSDHWNFGRLGVPFAFFFTGIHDDYHQPSDSPDKITYEAMANRLKMIYGATIELANDTERPVVDNEAFIQRTRAGN